MSRPWTPPTDAERKASRVFELARRPLAEKVTEQYSRGLITFWDMVAELTSVDLKVTAEGPKCACCHTQPAEWIASSLGMEFLACTNCARPASEIEPIA